MMERRNFLTAVGAGIAALPLFGLPKTDKHCEIGFRQDGMTFFLNVGEDSITIGTWLLIKRQPAYFFDGHGYQPDISIGTLPPGWTLRQLEPQLTMEFTAAENWPEQVKQSLLRQGFTSASLGEA